MAVVDVSSTVYDRAGELFEILFLQYHIDTETPYHVSSLFAPTGSFKLWLLAGKVASDEARRPDISSKAIFTVSKTLSCHKCDQISLFHGMATAKDKAAELVELLNTKGQGD